MKIQRKTSSRTITAQIVEIPDFANGHPHFPWPLPSDGTDIEVARWWYAPTTQRNGGHWVYCVRLSVWNRDAHVTTVEVSLRGFRFREDYITKRRSGSQLIGLWQELKPPRSVKRPPKNLVSAFRSFVQSIREKADQDAARYQQRIEASSW